MLLCRLGTCPGNLLRLTQCHQIISNRALATLAKQTGTSRRNWTFRNSKFPCSNNVEPVKNGICLSTMTMRSSSSSPPYKENPPDEIDEKENQKYEKVAEKKQQKWRLFKKAFSSILFVSTFVGVMLFRKRRQQQLEDNLGQCIFLRVDESFQGDERVLCRYGQDKVTGNTGCVLPISIVRDGTIRTIKNFAVRDDDVFIVSFPKTGTTWVQEIVYVMKNNMDFKKANDSLLETRSPYLEYPYPGLKSVEKMSSPRLIKTHLPYSLLPNGVNKAKIIYVTRNPKDTVVSYFHFARMLTFLSYKGTFEEFLPKFKDDQIPYAPFFGHIESFVERKDDPNVLIVTYEDLSKNPIKVIRRIGAFLDVPLTDDDAKRLAEHTTFDNMAINPAVNYSHWDDFGLRNKTEALFFRKGKVGDWRNYFSSHLNEDFNKWIQEKNSSGFNFVYDN